MNRRTHAGFLLAVLMLAGCASVPRSVDVSREQLQAALDKRFPFERRFLQMIDVKATGPLVALVPQANRIGVELTLTATDRMSRLPLEGRVAMSFVPRYEASDLTLRMGQVRIDNLELPSASPSWRGQVERIGGMLGEVALEGAVLHQFRPEEIARVQGWTPGDIRVTNTGVRITLAPPK